MTAKRGFKGPVGRWGMALTVPTVLVATGLFPYKPSKNSNGNATFAYEALDGPGGPDTATVAPDVKPVTG